MSIEESIPLFAYALDKEAEDRIFAQWVLHLPLMSLKMLKYSSFEEYKNLLTGKEVDQRSNEQIIAEIEELHNIHIDV